MTRTPFLVAALLATGCAATPPAGPGVLVLPGTGKSFDQFRADELECRSYAHRQAGDRATGEAFTLQQRYDFAFTQCMYARGHKVPVSGRYADAPRGSKQTAAPPPPPGQTPTGTPPDYRPQ